MSTKLIQTEEYLLLIDEEAEVCRGQHRFLNNKVEPIHEGHNYPYKGNKVIAYYPLAKEAKELDLPLLPNLFGDEINFKEIVENLPEHDALTSMDGTYSHFHYQSEAMIKGYELGYKAAQSKQFSLEDLKKAIDLTQQICDRNAHYVQRDRNVHVPMITIDEEEEIIRSLSTQQLPKEFIPEYEKRCWCAKPMNEGCFECSNLLKTITNSEGKEELVGTYKY